MAPAVNLNEQALALADYMAAEAALLRIQVHQGVGRTIDCGVKAEGGLQTGLCLARVCLAELADVRLTPGEVDGVTTPLVQVFSDHPVLACMASQYAGWQVQVGKFFAMGSGPMRAAYGKEALFNDIPGREQAAAAIGVLETRKLPGDDVFAHLADQLGLPADRITLLVAPASSTAGTLQVVARSVETALHKLHELKFDLGSVVSAFGSAPLPPVASNELSAIGRTNDAILYGGRVTLWVRGDDDQLADVGARVPSSSSPDYGEPFADVFARYNQDFYKIDPLLFSPGELVLNNLKTGRCHRFGKLAPDVLRRSFFGA